MGHRLIVGLKLDEVIARMTLDTNGKLDDRGRLLLTDPLNSVIAELNLDVGAELRRSMAYSPFGETAELSEQDDGSPILYTGRERDGTGLYFYRARYYAPHFKRFLQADPLGLLAGLNVFAYVENSPLMATDPTGLITFNKPAPATVPPEGETFSSLVCLETCLKGTTQNLNLSLLVTGGAEKNGHSTKSHHYKGEACDIAGPRLNVGVTNKDMIMCAKSCGFGAGQFEVFPENPGRDHWHLQMTPGNGVPPL